MNSEVKLWLDGFSEHLILMSEKYGSQAKYIKEVNIPAHYMSQIINKRFQEFSKEMVITMAERANYDMGNYRHICSLLANVSTQEWKEIKKETAVQYDNTRRRERAEFGGDMPGEVIENALAVSTRLSPPQDVYLVTRYVKMRNEIPFSKQDAPAIRRALIHNLCADLQKLDEKELC